MKLTGIVFFARLLMTISFTFVILISNARVFWNKFEVSANKDNIVELTWNVTEYNNKSFIVQHSVNGTDWDDIAIIQSKNSAETMTDYSYTHQNRLGGKQFYRLKDIDVDTKSIGISPVKTLMLENNKDAVSVWPNPTTHFINIANSKNNNYTKVGIYDLMGKTMIETKLNTGINEIPVSQLPSGTYLLKIENSQGESTSRKIVKQ